MLHHRVQQVLEHSRIENRFEFVINGAPALVPRLRYCRRGRAHVRNATFAWAGGCRCCRCCGRWDVDGRFWSQTTWWTFWCFVAAAVPGIWFLKKIGNWFTAGFTKRIHLNTGANLITLLTQFDNWRLCGICYSLDWNVGQRNRFYRPTSTTTQTKLKLQPTQLLHLHQKPHHQNLLSYKTGSPNPKTNPTNTWKPYRERLILLQ